MSSEVVFVHYFYCKCSKIRKQYDSDKFESLKGEYFIWKRIKHNQNDMDAFFE